MQTERPGRPTTTGHRGTAAGQGANGLAGQGCGSAGGHSTAGSAARHAPDGGTGGGAVPAAHEAQQARGAGPARALAGVRVVVTRPRHQAGGLVERLRARGATTIEVPAIEIGPPADGGRALARAVGQVAAGHYGTVIFTSANGVERFFAAVLDPGQLAGVRVAAIGKGTDAALAGHGVTAELLPQRSVAESLLAALGPPPPAGARGAPAGGEGRARRVLLARAAVARDVLPDGLRAAGWEVDVVEAYRTRQGTPTQAELARVPSADAICFASSSTVEHYLALTAGLPVPPAVVCIGPVTAKTARAHGLAVAAVAEPHTIPGLVDALVAALAA